MVISIVDLIFAFIFAAFALNAVRRGWMLLKAGWLLVQTHAEDNPMSVENRRWISQGGTFFIGGGLWIGGAIIAGLLALQFGFRGLFP